MWSCVCSSSAPVILSRIPSRRGKINGIEPCSSSSCYSFYCIIIGDKRRTSLRVCGGVRASMVDSSSSNFIKRMEQSWLISQQPTPIGCSSCNSNGHVECKWCQGTGFFILGDDMLCQVPSRNTRCLICAGEGSNCCSDCKGTGFRAKWLGDPPLPK
ncbi:hypothetical protein AQUCO_01600342v1 [Aquilegia coerulea]|uniref:Uncharacterized protein n=2 Tax=Aquilegia coerulea TaxID=218851 RepID=A0A2G5DR74_AQUCA|nr:hypothetical protein AQUCO_01600342v1 [Aquilegia coerulea]